jgi:hypothetical protein
MIGFIELFDTTRDYTLQFTITHTHACVHNHVYTNRCSVAAFNDDVPLPLSSRTTRGLSYQLLTATAHND